MPVAGAAGFVAVHGDVENASFHQEGTALAPFGRDHFVDEVALGRGAREVFEEKRRV